MDKVKIKVLAASMKKSVEYVEALVSLCTLHEHCGFSTEESIKQSVAALEGFESGWPSGWPA